MRIDFNGDRYTFALDLERELIPYRAKSSLESNIVGRTGAVVGQGTLDFLPSVSNGVASVDREGGDLSLRINYAAAQRIIQKGSVDLNGLGIGVKIRVCTKR